MRGLVRYDELVTAPVLITPIRKVPADDDGDLSAPVGEKNTVGEIICSLHKDKRYIVT